MLRDSAAATRHAGRIRAISATFLRHGLSDLLVRTGLHQALSRLGRVIRVDVPPPDALPVPERLCRAFEELGPTFVKLGQLFASRVDSFPPDWIEAFERLQDRVPAVPFAELEAQLLDDLGAPPHDVFRDLNETPLAAGSLAQVYTATLEDGTPVVLKVRRPGIETVVERDLEILEWIAGILERESSGLRAYRPQRLAAQFARAMRTELDFSAECDHAERIGRQFADDPDVIIPRMFRTWRSERLNVQERIDGVRATDLASVDAAPDLDRAVLARRGARALFTMVLGEGTFHGDPHPGNILFLPKNRIALIDFGVIAHLSETQRDQLTMLFAALIDRRSHDAVDILEQWAMEGPYTADLADDIDEMLNRYHGVPLERIDTMRMLGDLTGLLREHRIRLPREAVMLIKAVMLVAGLGKRLDPSFDVFAAMRPEIRRAVRQRMSPERLLRRTRRSALDTLNLLTHLPRDARRLLSATSRGQFRLQADLGGLDSFGRRMERALARLTIGIVLAAIIIGSAIGMTTMNQPRILGIPVLAYLGATAAAIATGWLIASFWRGRR